jgi:Flp pilus assembly protein TadD
MLRPDDAEALTLLGQCYLGMGRYQAAADASVRALALDQAQRQARYVLGMSWMRLGRVEEGTRALREFQQLQAAATEAANREWELTLLKQQAAASIDKEDFESAVRWLDQAVAYEPGSAAIHTSLALALARVGRYDSAIEHLNQALALNGSLEIFRELAEMYDKVGRHDDAVKQRENYERAKRERLSRAGGSR